MNYIRGLSQSDLLVTAELISCSKEGDAAILGTPGRDSRRALSTQRGMTKCLYLFATLCLTFCSGGLSAYAQSTFGSILGAVQDPSGAVVPGAVVRVQNLNDNTTREARTNDAGEYLVLNLNPGSYSVTASAANFVDKSLTGLTLSARQQLRADMKLQLAGSQTTVEVEAAEAAVVNTENGTIGDTKIFDQVVELPMNYRGGNDSPLAALTAVPGVQQDSNGNVSIGGGTSAQIQYSVDGTSTVNIRQNGALNNMNPSSELISEFKVTQFNNNAEFSQMADVTIITKSGSKNFHGSVFEYLQNSALDAKSAIGGTYGSRRCDDLRLGLRHRGGGGCGAQPVDQRWSEPRSDLHRRLVHGGRVRRRRQRLGHPRRWHDAGRRQPGARADAGAVLARSWCWSG